MNKMFKKVILGMLILGCSNIAMANDGGFKNYSELINKQYSKNIEIIQGIKDAELEIEKSGELLILEIEIEAEKTLGNKDILKSIDPIISDAINHIKEDYNNNIRLVVERDDYIIKSESL